MTPEEQVTIDRFIRENRSFAMYRIPGEDTIHFLMQSKGKPEFLYDIEALNEKSGYVIAPFRISPGFPIVIIHPDTFEIPTNISSTEEKMFFPDSPLSCPIHKEHDYPSAFSLFMEALQEKRLEKLVLSRKKRVDKPSGFSPAQVFQSACDRYIRSYVYLCHTPHTGTWIGSSPEILLSGEGNEWQTVALAGTKSLIDGQLPENWDEKNRQEQQMVSYYIQKQLFSAGIVSSEKGPFTVRAGELAHLKTEFSFHLKDTHQLGNILELLHPTPAVCGLPKQEAFEFIMEHEGYIRDYYSGFIGWLNPEKRSDIYVNLRCLKVEHTDITLYAGSGLLPSSGIQEEWQETEEKLKTMFRLI